MSVFAPAIQDRDYCAYPYHAGRDWERPARMGGGWVCGICHPPPSGVDAPFRPPRPPLPKPPRAARRQPAKEPEEPALAVAFAPGSGATGSALEEAAKARARAWIDRALRDAHGPLRDTLRRSLTWY